MMSNFELMDHRQMPAKNIAHGRKETSAYNSKTKRHIGILVQPKINFLLQVTNVLLEDMAAGEITDQQRLEVLPLFMTGELKTAFRETDERTQGKIIYCRWGILAWALFLTNSCNQH